MTEYLLKVYFLLPVATEQLVAVAIFWTYLAKVFKLYLGWFTGYSSLGVSGYFPFVPGKCWDITL